MQPLWREKRAEKRRNGWPSARFFLVLVLVLVVSGLIFDYENGDEDEEENDRG
jgi:hypothetical protein